jgi:hypothetical protein
MRRLVLTFFPGIALMMFLFSAPAVGSQAAPASPFEKLKTLVGTWEATAPNGEVFTSTIRLVSNGTAIEETFQSSEANQMVTLYTPDGEKLAMTHYCSSGNQPRMETAAVKGDTKLFEFRLTGITNLSSPEAGHMMGHTVEIADSDHFTENWTWRENDKERTETFRFTRKK